MLVADVAANGDSAIVASLGTLAGSLGSTEAITAGSVYLDTRTSTGWHVTPLDAPFSEFVGQYTVLTSAEADSGETLWIQHTPEQGAYTRGLYVRTAQGKFKFIGPASPLSEPEEEPSDLAELEPPTLDKVRGSTSNYGHIVLEAENANVRWPFDETIVDRKHHSLYEYSGVENSEPILVGVEGTKGSRQLIAQCGTVFGSGIFGSSYNALSNDGEAIFFTVNPCGLAPATPEVYARLHGSALSAEPAKTVHVSASECTVACGESESSKNFEGASENGKLVYFTSTQKLTNDAIDGTATGDASRSCAAIPASIPPATGGCNLYLFDLEGPTGEQLRSVSTEGEVLGVVGIAENGSRVYYVSRAKVGSAGIEGQPNLYVYDAATEETTFIATLESQDENDWSRTFRKPAQIAGSSGRFLLFASSTVGITPDDTSPVVQLFEYKAPGEGETDGSDENSELVRVTKGEEDFNDNGNGVGTGVSRASISEGDGRLGNSVDFKTTTNSLNISVDGRRVFFTTVGMLSPRATAAENGCESLYEFEAPGRLLDGAVHLISDGSDISLFKSAFCGVGFQGIDGLGDNALFSTGDPLLPGDGDSGQRDTYDARVGGGFGSSLAAPACSLQSCESPVVGPSLPEAGSASAVGESLISSTTAPKGNATQKKGSGGKRPDRLRRALRACRGKPRSRRASCEHSVRRRFMPAAIVREARKGGR